MGLRGDSNVLIIFKMVLSIDLFRQDKGHDPQLIRDSQKKRHKRVELVDEVVEADALWRTVQFQTEQWNRIRNRCGKSIGMKIQAKENEGETEDLLEDVTKNLATLELDDLNQLTIKQIKHISLLADREIGRTKERLIQIENQRLAALHEIGNIVHESVPVSNDEVSE